MNFDLNKNKSYYNKNKSYYDKNKSYYDKNKSYYDKNKPFRLFYYRNGERLFNRRVDFSKVKVNAKDINFILRTIMRKMGDLEKFEMFFSIIVDLFYKDFNQCGLFLKFLKIIHMWSFENFYDLIAVLDPFKLSIPSNFNYFFILVSRLAITKLTKIWSIMKYYDDFFELFKGKISSYCPITVWRDFAYLKDISSIRYVNFLRYCVKYYIKFSTINKMKDRFSSKFFRSILLRVIFSNKRKLYLGFLNFLKYKKDISVGSWELYCDRFEYFLAIFSRFSKNNSKENFDYNQNPFFFILKNFGLKIEKSKFNEIAKNFVKSGYFLKYPKLSEAPVIYNDEWLKEDLFFKKAVDHVSNVVFPNSKQTFIFSLIFFWFIFFFKFFFYVFNKVFINFWFYLFYYLSNIYIKNYNAHFFQKFFVYINDNFYPYFCVFDIWLNFYIFVILVKYLNFCSYKNDFFCFSSFLLRRLNFRGNNVYCSKMCDDMSGEIFEQLFPNFIGKLNLGDLRASRTFVSFLIFGFNREYRENYFWFLKNDYEQIINDHVGLLRGLYFLNSKKKRR